MVGLITVNSTGKRGGREGRTYCEQRREMGRGFDGGREGNGVIYGGREYKVLERGGNEG